MTSGTSPIAEHGLATLPNEAWERGIRPNGELAALFSREPQSWFTNGLSENKQKPELVGLWGEPIKALNEDIVEARHNRETARSLFTLASYGQRDPESRDRLRVAFVQEGIPPEFLSHYVPTGPFAFHSISDWLSDAL